MNKPITIRIGGPPQGLVGRGVGLFFLVAIFSGAALVPDFFIGRQIWRETPWHYSTTIGQMTRSTFRHYRHAGRETYDLYIGYHYQVNGRDFDGARFRYDSNSTSDPAWAEKVINEHPVGSKIEVFFNPDDPRDSLLLPGVDGTDMLNVMACIPFNTVMILLCTWYADWLRVAISKPALGGLRVKADGLRTHVRLPKYPADTLTRGSGVVIMLSVVSLLIHALGRYDHPSIAVVSGEMFVVFAAGMGTYVWQWRRTYLGDYDLILDEGARTIGFPMTYGRKERITVGFDDVDGVTVEALPVYGGGGNIWGYGSGPTVHLRGKEGSDLLLNRWQDKLYGSTGHSRGRKGSFILLANWGDKMKAEALVEWLRQRLGKAG